MIQSDIEFLTSLLHGSVRTQAIKYMPELRVIYKDKEVCQSILTIIQDLGTEPLTDTYISLSSYKHKIPDLIYNRVIEVVNSLRNYTTKEIKILYEAFQNLICSFVIQTKANDFQNDPVLFVKFLKDFDFNLLPIELSNSNFIKEYTFDNINYESVMTQLENPIKSSLDIVNEASPVGGWITSQLIMVCGPPAGGKSILMMNECISALKQNKNVLYSALGDLNEYDFISRMCAILMDVSLTAVTMNLSYFYKATLERFPFVKNLKIQLISPDAIDVNDYCTYLDSKGLVKWADLFIVDYDSNFKSEAEFYNKGDEIYTSLSNISDIPGKLVMVGAQPKINYWEEEILYKDSVGESSRKQHIVDCLLTISHPSSPYGVNHIGYINFAKNRRGKELKSPYFLDKNGRIKLIDTKVYNYLQREDKPITFSQGDVLEARKISEEDIK